MNEIKCMPLGRIRTQRRFKHYSFVDLSLWTEIILSTQTTAVRVTKAGGAAAAA